MLELFIVYILGFSTLLYISLIKGRELEMVPSVFWLYCMLLPFMLQRSYFSSIYSATQAVGIFSFGLTLMICDFVGVIHLRRGVEETSVSRLEFGVCVGLIAVSISLQSIHYLSMPKIPLLEMLFTAANDNDLKLMRENSSKLLNMPTSFIYACQISLTFFPVLLSTLIKVRKYAWSGLFLLSSLVYSKATLAKGPMYSSVLLLAVLIWQEVPKNLRVRLGKVFFPLLMIPVVWVFVVVTWIDLSQEQRTATQPDRQGELTFTWSDHSRLFGKFPEVSPFDISLPKPLQALAYRAFIVPAEVSHRWYTYFPDVSGGPLGVYGLTPASRNSPAFVHPSNIVGMWAYVRRFPRLYRDSIHAYASADADVHARFGHMGILVCCLFIALMRYCIFSFGSTCFSLRKLQCALLLILGINLPYASLQAILVAHGLIGGVSLLVIVAFLRRFSIGKVALESDSVLNPAN